MSRYFKGAGVGTYWHIHDAMVLGFHAASPGTPAGVTVIKDHIVYQLVQSSPYISLTRSYEIAEAYARYYGKTLPTATNGAFVYEIDIPNSTAASLVDPVQELAASFGPPYAPLFYQHDGGPDLLLGLVDSANFGNVLTRPIRAPGVPIVRPPRITDELHALVRALRDAEVLALHAIPRTCLINKHQVN
jgi:hypothetical protein